MQVKDYPLECSQCGEKVGILTLGYFGIPHHMEPVICCMRCLPGRIAKVKSDGTADKDTISKAQKWLEN